MNRTEALKALLEGKVIIGVQGYPARFDPYGGFEKFADGAWVSEQFNFRGANYELYNPNPHKPGTFDWAEFEVLGGKTVRREGSCIRYNAAVWTCHIFRPQDFRATDWEVVE